MKVTGVKGALPALGGARELEGKPVLTDAQHAFSRQLSDLSEQQQVERAQQQLEDIREQGERMIKRADIRELQKYRSMVAKMMEDVVSGAYSFQKSGWFDARGRHKMFAIVKKVNTRLDELAKQMISDQRDNLMMLDAVDDIRGLLVDLIM